MSGGRGRVVVTGGTGLIGGELLPLLSDRDVTALGRDGGPSASHVDWLPYDLAADDPDGLLPPQADAVVHLAQSRRFREFPGGASDVFAVNVASTLRLLEWAASHGVSTFVLASSGGVYGHGDVGFREDDLRVAKEPLGFYLGSKRSAELLAEPFAELMNIVILRFFFVYGRRQHTSMLIPRLVGSVRERRPITLQGHDGINLNPVHVSDAAAAVVRALDLGSSTHLNVAGPEVLSMRAIAETIGKRVGTEPTFDLAEQDEPRHLVGDIARMTEVLGPPVVHFADGVAELCGAGDDQT